MRKTLFSLCLALLTLTGLAHASSYEEAVQATIRNQGSALTEVLKKGLDPNTISPTGDPLITLAIKNKADQSAQALMAHPQIDINLANGLGETPLMIAVFSKQNKIAKALLKQGAKVDNPKNWAPLHYAASAGNHEMVQLLLSKGANPNARTLRGITPLYMAARDADLKMVQLLLKAGARKDFCNNEAVSAAQIAKERGNSPDVVELLEIDHCR